MSATINPVGPILFPVPMELITGIFFAFALIIKSILPGYKILYNLKTPDAIIAATAKSLKLPLVTGDKKLLKVEDIITVHFNPEI